MKNKNAIFYPTQLHDYLTYAAIHYPDRVAIVYKEQRLTYQQLDILTNRVANYFLSMNLMRGARVVACLGNCTEAIIVFWSVLKAGGVVSLISHTLKPEKIEYIIRDAGCQFFITHPEMVDQLYQNTYSMHPVLSHLKNIFVVENKSSQTVNHEYTASHRIPNNLYIDFNEALQFPLTQTMAVKNLDIDLASIIYTSGSTGEPKGVMLTHRNMLAASQSINSYLNNNADDIFLSALPLSFDYGLYQMIMAVSVGARFILEKDFLLPLRFMKKIEEEKVTVLPGVPTLFSILGDTSHYFSFDLTSVRYVTNTGAAIYDHHLDIIQTLFANARFFSMYGLTECKRCTYLPPDDLKHKSNSVGIAIPNTEMWIVNEEGQRLAPHQVGQLVIRGATVMHGYWNLPEESAKKLQPGLLPGEKILFTGDYGLLDEEGYFYFKGRMDETIKSRGIKVSPKEIEEVIYSIQDIKEAAVIGVAHAELGHAIVACVSCEATSSLDAAAILMECKQFLEKEKQPQRVILFSTLPKSNNGKIDKKSLQEMVMKMPEHIVTIAIPITPQDAKVNAQIARS